MAHRATLAGSEVVEIIETKTRGEIDESRSEMTNAAIGAFWIVVAAALLNLALIGFHVLMGRLLGLSAN